MTRAPEPCPTCSGEDEPEIEDVCEACGFEGHDCQCRRDLFDTREEEAEARGEV